MVIVKYQKGDKVKIVKGPYKNKTATLNRRDNSNLGWYALIDDKEMIFVEDKEIDR
jgi:transcription antitermination factor NusG